MKIAYQGIAGSYSESCVKEKYPDCETIPCKTFDECFEKANQDNSIKTIIPESNKTTGNIGVEYLIFKYRLNIYAEHFFSINHNLLGIKGSKLSDISRKSIVSSVSDFAAKGIIPKFCIISITLPKTISKKQVQELSKGFSKACKEFKIQLLGGDTNQGTEISIHVVLFGNVKKYTKRKELITQSRKDAEPNPEGR